MALSTFCSTRQTMSDLFDVCVQAEENEREPPQQTDQAIPDIPTEDSGGREYHASSTG